MKVVINKCYGGFSVSPEAALWLYEHGYRGREFVHPTAKYFGSEARRREALGKWRDYQTTAKASRPSMFMIHVFTPDEKSVLSTHSFERDHPLLVECVEALGKAANGSCAELRVIEIPDGIKWEISEYDGMESVEEAHRSWR